MSNRRRTRVVNKPYQGRMILSISLFPSIGLAVGALLVSVFCNRLSREAGQFDVELESLLPLFLTVVGFLFAAGLFLVVNAMKISHQVAGPMYRISQSLRRMRHGDLNFKVGLRKGDHLDEIAEELNLLLDALNDNPFPGATTRAMALQNLDDDEVEAPDDSMDVNAVDAPVSTNVGTDVEEAQVNRATQTAKN